MNKRINILITILVILAVAGISFFIISSKSTGAAVTDNSAEVAKYIGEHSVLYVQTGCSHCETQKALFGEDYQYLTVVDCLEDSQTCVLNNIEGTPTWEINGKLYEGVQSIEKLKELTGYQS